MNYIRSDIVNDLIALAVRLPSDPSYYTRPDNRVRDILLDLADCVRAADLRKERALNHYLGRKAATARSADAY